MDNHVLGRVGWGRCMRNAGVLFLLIALAGCHRSEQAQEDPTLNYNPPKTVAEVRLRAPASTAWIETKNDFPDDFAKFGAKEMKRLNGITYWAGVAALDNRWCDAVEQSAISGHSVVNSVSWFIDCKNGQRAHVSEAQARAAQKKWPDALTS